MSLVQRSQCASIGEYVAKFLYYLQNETGFKKEAFTRAGVQLHLKRIAKTFYKCNLINEVVQMIIHIATSFGNSMKTKQESKEITICRIVDILEASINFLVMAIVGELALFATAKVTGCMVIFITGLYYFICFIIAMLLECCFSRLKDWILTLTKSKEVELFFDKVFGSYGRAIMA